MLRTPRMKRFAPLAALAVLATACGLTSALALASAELAPALKAVQGVWVSDENDEIRAKWTISDDAITASVNGVDYVGKVVVDDKSKPHPSFTIDVKQGPTEVQGKSAKGVYKVDGEKLIVNISVPGGDRPKDFDPYGDEVYLFELKKEKK